jgi:hypothetical protein
LSLLYFEKWSLNKKIAYFVIPIAFFAIMLSIRSSTLLAFLNVAMIYVLLMLMTIDFTATAQRIMTLGRYIKSLFLPITSFLVSGSSLLLTVFTLPKNAKDPEIVRKIITWIIISIPIGIAFVTLFVSADTVFGNYVNKLITFQIPYKSLLDILYVVILTIVFSWFFYSFLAEKANVATPEEKEQPNYIVEFTVIASILNALFLGFIIVQLNYLFGSELPSASSITYSEYARSGFWQLVIIILLVFMVIRVGGYYMSKHNMNYKAYSIFLIVQTLIIALSAWKRMYLYEMAYGLTTLRLYVHVFILLLIFLLGFLTYQILKEKSREIFIFGTFISCVVFLAVMNLINPDRIITTYNMKNLEKPDVYYSIQLWDDSIWAMLKVLSSWDANDPRRVSYSNVLNNHHLRIDTPWVSWTLAEERAWKAAEKFKLRK